MPKVAKELSAVAVRNLKRPGFHAVGGVAGLVLQVTDTGARSWVLRATIGGKVRHAGLGPYPEVTLAVARDKAREMREAIREGRDPIEERKAAKRALAAERARRLTFKEAAKQTHAVRAAGYRSEGHVRDWIKSLERYAFPHIGNIPVNEIELVHVLKVLQPIWTSKSGGTAENVRLRMMAVFKWAKASKYRTGDNPARWEDNLKEVLQSPAKIHMTKHRTALPWQEAPAFVQALRQRYDPAAKALEFTILTAARPGEARLVPWEEIDLTAKLWTIPPERTKAGKRHRVPLSDDAVELLRSVDCIDDEPLVFAFKRGKAIRDNLIVQIAREISGEIGGDPKLTVHGFRSTFKDWARIRTRFPDEVSELALAHSQSGGTRAAYARDELLPQRAKLIEAWAKFLREEVRVAEVVSIGKAAESVR